MQAIPCSSLGESYYSDSEPRVTSQDLRDIEERDQREYEEHLLDEERELLLLEEELLIEDHLEEGSTSRNITITFSTSRKISSRKALPSGNYRIVGAPSFTRSKLDTEPHELQHHGECHHPLQAAPAF